MKGWIKIHRKMLENPIVMKDSDHLAVWVYLLLNAAHKERKVLFKGDKIMLQPGQLITGRNAIADFLGISESKVKRVLSDFEGDQQIDRQRSNKNSLISLINWDKYQFCDQQSDQQVTSKMTSKWTTNVLENGQQSDQQTNSRKPAENGHFEDSEDRQVTSKMTSKRPAGIPKSDQQSDHKQEDKEDKKEKKDRYSLRSPEVDRTIEAWNDLGLRPVKKIPPSSRRYQNLMERIEENGIDDVLQAIQKIRDSSYLQGKTEGGRMIELEWFVDPDNFSKVLEGYYDDSEQRQQDNSRRDDSEPEPETDRFACMDQGLRREMERVGVIVGQTLNFAGCSVDDAGRYIDWLNGIEIQEDEMTPETFEAEGWIDVGSMSEEEFEEYLREHCSDYK